MALNHYNSKGSDKSDKKKNISGKKTNLPIWNIIFFILFLIIANYFLKKFLNPDEESIKISYSIFKEQVSVGNVKTVFTKGEQIEGKFEKSIFYKPYINDNFERGDSIEVDNFKTVVPFFADEGLESLLLDHQVEILTEKSVEESSGLWTFIAYFGPILLLILFYFWIFRSSNPGNLGGMMGNMGQSKAKRFDEDNHENVTFDDVAGIDEAENELVEIVEFLKNPEKFTKLGASAPKGVLLVGAPGTGKTLLAKAVAGESGVPFFSMSASEFVEMIVGVGAARVRDLFRLARENAPAIIFIDELDSIGRARGHYITGSGSEQEQTLNQILTEMDEFTSQEGIIVLAATNQPDILDKALLRAGRFDRRVVVNSPDKAGRIAILKVHTRKVPLDPQFSFEEIATATPGFTGADLKNLVNEAALLASHQNAVFVSVKDFLNALEKIILGPERPIVLSYEDRERIAYHESGHAILGLVVEGADPVNRVTIVPRGQALGVTYQRPVNDRYNYPEQYLKAKIIGILGGRTAEEIVFGTKTTGAENDIELATNIARQMVTRWGMSEKLGMVMLAPRQNDYLNVTYNNEKPFSEETAKIIDSEVLRIIKECHEESTKLLLKFRNELDALAKALLDSETLDEIEILKVTGLSPAPEIKASKK